MIHYIIQILIFQILFLAIYDLLLKKETFFQWNRAYLILSSILAYILPFIQINSVSSYVKNDLTFKIPTILLEPNTTTYLNEVVIGSSTSKFHLSTFESIYLVGIVLTSILFAHKISQIYRKITQNKIIKKEAYNLVILSKQPTAFSFFNYLFLGKSIYQKEHQHIIDHELIHIKQKHSLDLLFFEIQKIIFWMNPFSYLFQYRIATLHEYIADAKAIKEHPKQQFFENLLHQTFQVEKFAFVNQFYKKSLIKKRIIMATKNKSKEILKLKYLLVLPLLFTMLIYTSSFGQNKEEKIDTVLKVDPILFSVVTKTPIYPGCENPSKKIAKKCTSKEISNHVARNFNTKLANSLQLSAGMKRISMQFTIDKNGNTTNVRAKAPHLKLQEEAIRVIKLMPKMSPGEQDGKPVSVRYNLPIKFKINSEQKVTAPPPPPKSIKLKPLNKDVPPPPPSPIDTIEIEYVPFSVIDDVPVYPGCEGNNFELKKCMQQQIANHVSENFNLGLAKSLGLKAGKKRISVQFKIDTNGNATDVKARTPHPKLQKEAIRIIKLLPKMKAGKQNGKAVNVRYNLPILFEINGKDKVNNKVYLEGIIDNKFGYLSSSKESLTSSIIAALDYESNKKYKVMRFQLKIENEKTIEIVGNRFNAISLQKINQLKIGSRIRIFNIKTASKNTNIEDIVIKIK